MVDTHLRKLRDTHRPLVFTEDVLFLCWINVRLRRSQGGCMTEMVKILTINIVDPILVELTADVVIIFS